MSEDECRFELPEGCYKDDVYTNWVKVLTIRIEKKLISEFVKTFDYIMERIEFHTENPDSELMDEVSEEYKKWEEKLK